MEIGQEEASSEHYTVLMQSDAGGRLRTEYRALRRQMCFIQFMTVSLCLTCAFFTLVYQAHTSGCKEKGILDSPAIGMQKQALESHSSKETSQGQRLTPFIHLSVVGKGFSGSGNVMWKLMTDSVKQSEYFTLDSDNETLVVLCDGTYKISLQIMYRGFPGWLSSETKLWHEIRRRTNGYPEPLTMLVYEESINFKATPWKKTLFSEGVYFLERGDRIKVWSHNRMLIDNTKNVSQKTFIVAYPLFSS